MLTRRLVDCLRRSRSRQTNTRGSGCLWWRPGAKAVRVEVGKESSVCELLAVKACIHAGGWPCVKGHRGSKERGGEQMRTRRLSDCVARGQAVRVSLDKKGKDTKQDRSSRTDPATRLCLVGGGEKLSLGPCCLGRAATRFS